MTTQDMRTRDTRGLYYQGRLVADNYTDAVALLRREFDEPAIPYVGMEAPGYSVIDNRGVQHIYELDPQRFVDELCELELYELDLI